MFLQLYDECENDGRYSEYKRLGPRPVEALQSFGGRVEKWRNLGLFEIFTIFFIYEFSGLNQNLTTSSRPTDSSSSTGFEVLMPQLQ
jgi:hypothetical protein